MNPHMKNEIENLDIARERLEIALQSETLVQMDARTPQGHAAQHLGNTRERY